jgi:hypothetical protein
MADIKLLDAKYDSRPSHRWELDRDSVPSPESISGFDKVGYHLTKLEMEYAFINGSNTNLRRSTDRYVVSSGWFSQDDTDRGAVLGSALLLERKGYDATARKQLSTWCDARPIFHKLLNIKPRWGFEFSMDWIGNDGATFEILHYEFHGTDLDMVDDLRKQTESKLNGVDWHDAAATVMRRTDAWKHRDLASQRHLKCELLGFKHMDIQRSVWDD